MKAIHTFTPAEVAEHLKLLQASKIKKDIRSGAILLQLAREFEAVAQLATERESQFVRLERQYCQRLGEMARLSDIVCTWVLEHSNLDEESPEVKVAAEEIMEYVDAVRPPEASEATETVTKEPATYCKRCGGSAFMGKCEECGKAVQS